MNYIVLDLEYNKTRGRSREILEKYIFEIIEIGAVKLSEEFEILDTFRVYIKPNIYKNINKDVQNITNITKEDLEFGYNFIKAFKYFKNWRGNDNIYCTWSDNDIKVLIDNCKYYRINTNKWFNKFIDVQNELQYFLKEGQKIGLVNAINKLHLNIEGKTFHNALDDAFYTAKILQFLYVNKVDFTIQDIDSNSLKFYTIKSNNIKFESADQRFIIKCPLCDIELPKEYSIRKGMKMKSLGTCSICNNKVLHGWRNRYMHGSKSTMVYNKIISVDEYNQLSENMNKI